MRATSLVRRQANAEKSSHGIEFFQTPTCAWRTMMKLNIFVLLPLIVLAVNGCASNDPISGRIFNNTSPYFLKTDDGDLYQVTWYSGYQVHAGDEVILTNDA